MQEVRLNTDPQAFLRELSARTSVYHFELTRPSLHDIFVRIAKPMEQEVGASRLMNKTLIVATSEFSTLVRTKAFVITLILMPVLMGASIGLSRAAEGRDRHQHPHGSPISTAAA